MVSSSSKLERFIPLPLKLVCSYPQRRLQYIYLRLSSNFYHNQLSVGCNDLQPICVLIYYIANTLYILAFKQKCLLYRCISIYPTKKFNQRFRSILGIENVLVILLSDDFFSIKDKINVFPSHATGLNVC